MCTTMEIMCADEAPGLSAAALPTESNVDSIIGNSPAPSVIHNQVN